MTGLRVFLSRHKAMTLVVRGSSATDLDSLRAAVRGVVQKVDPVVPISEIRMGEDHADPQLGAVRLTAEVSMLLGPVALTLAGLIRSPRSAPSRSVVFGQLRRASRYRVSAVVRS
ncbi:MAG: hypothetical protein ACM4AI_22955 [Acidobacteriota bacterium]